MCNCPDVSGKQFPLWSSVVSDCSTVFAPTSEMITESWCIADHSFSNQNYSVSLHFMLSLCGNLCYSPPMAKGASVMRAERQKVSRGQFHTSLI